MSVTNETYAELMARNNALETKLGDAKAALRLAHDALFNESGDGVLHSNAVRAIDAVLFDMPN